MTGLLEDMVDDGVGRGSGRGDGQVVPSGNQVTTVTMAAIATTAAKAGTYLKSLGLLGARLDHIEACAVHQESYFLQRVENPDLLVAGAFTGE